MVFVIYVPGDGTGGMGSFGFPITLLACGTGASVVRLEECLGFPITLLTTETVVRGGIEALGLGFPMTRLASIC
jgi:hypothetical protein